MKDKKETVLLLENYDYKSSYILYNYDYDYVKLGRRGTISYSCNYILLIV